MDYKIIWSPDALDDIDAICSYIARDSIYYAESVADSFFEAAQNLIKFPSMGRVVPEFGKKSIRELFV